MTDKVILQGDIRQLSLVINEGDASCVAFIRLSAKEALEMYRQMRVAFYEKVKGIITVTVGVAIHNFPEEIWHAILARLDSWFEDYLDHFEIGTSS